MFSVSIFRFFVKQQTETVNAPQKTQSTSDQENERVLSRVTRMGDLISAILRNLPQVDAMEGKLDANEQ